MRPSPAPNQMKARQLFLDCHRNKITNDYMLSNNNLSFDEDVREILLNGKYIGESIFNALTREEMVRRVLSLRNQHKKALSCYLDAPNCDYRKGWNIHMDYESLIMDKVISLNEIPVELLTVQSGRTFYNQQRMLKLMHQGFQLTQHEPYHSQSAWFSQWNNEWYFKNALTKYRLIDILQQYKRGWADEFAKQNSPEHGSLDATYSAMKDVHRNELNSATRAQNIFKEFTRRNPHLKHYITFVAEAMEYNEELRLMRSQSVYNFIQGCVKNKVNPYDEFLDVIKERKSLLDKLYGGNIK